MMRKAASLLVLLLVTIPFQLHALGLSDIEVVSSLNQPLDANIQVTELQEGDLEALQVSLGTAEQFAQSGLERPFFLSQLRFEVTPGAGRRATIGVTTREPAKEPFLNFLIEVSWPSGRLVREYTVLLDPPLYSGSLPSPIPQPQTQPQTTIVELPYSAEAAPTVVESAPTPIPITTVEVATPAAAAYPGASYAVRRGDTLWAIAERVKPGTGVSVQQAMVGLLNSNPQAFVGGNMNALKAGAVLRIPELHELDAVTRAEAIAEATRQYAEWKGRRQARAPLVAAAPEVEPVQEVVAAETAPQDEPAVPPPAVTPAVAVEEQAQLKLVAAGNTTDAPGGTAAETTDVAKLRDELNLAMEEADSKRLENEDLRARLAEAESLVSDLQRLLALKDDSIAALQSKLAEQDQPAEDTEAMGAVGAEGETGVSEAGPDSGVVGGAEPDDGSTQTGVSDTVTDTAGTDTAGTDMAGTETAGADVAGTDAAGADGGSDTVAESPAAEAESAGVEGEGTPAESTAEDAPAATAESPAATAEVTESEPTESAAATAQTAQATPPTPPKAAVPPPEPTSFLDSLAEILPVDPMLLASGVGVLMLAGGIALARKRRSPDRAEEALTTEEQRVLAEMEAQASAPAEAPMGAPNEDLTDAQTVARGGIEIEEGQEDSEADPLAEANVYLAYERFDQAEALVKEAINEHPDRPEYRLKLLEIYHASGNAAGFEKGVVDLKSAVGEDSPLMEKAAAWWEDIAPDKNLAAVLAAGVAGVAATAAIGSTATATETMLPEPEPDVSVTESVARALSNDDTMETEPVAPPPNVTVSTLDFDLGLDFDEKGEEGVAERSDTDIDFDLGEAEAAPATPSADETIASADETIASAKDSNDISGLDFDLVGADEATVDEASESGLEFELGDTDEATGQGEAVAAVDAGSDDVGAPVEFIDEDATDIDLSLDERAGLGELDLSDTTDLDIKLDEGSETTASELDATGINFDLDETQDTTSEALSVFDDEETVPLPGNAIDLASTGDDTDTVSIERLSDEPLSLDAGDSLAAMFDDASAASDNAGSASEEAGAASDNAGSASEEASAASEDTVADNDDTVVGADDGLELNLAGLDDSIDLSLEVGDELAQTPEPSVDEKTGEFDLSELSLASDDIEDETAGSGDSGLDFDLGFDGADDSAPELAATDSDDSSDDGSSDSGLDFDLDFEAPGAGEPTVVTDDDSMETGLDFNLDFNADEDDTQLMGPGSAAADDDGLDFDLEFDDTPAAEPGPPAGSELSPLAGIETVQLKVSRDEENTSAENSTSVDSPALGTETDLELARDITKMFETSSSADSSADQGDAIDFDLTDPGTGGSDMLADEGGSISLPDAGQGGELDFDLTGELGADVDEMQTKLDLANLYIDMGDTQGARDALDEVATGGSDEQKQTAKELLTRLG